MKVRPNIGEHDLQVKIKQVKKFLEKGKQVKLTVMFRGREMAFTDKGKEVLDRIQEECKDVARVEGQAKLKGRDMKLNLAPVSQS